MPTASVSTSSVAQRSKAIVGTEKERDQPDPRGQSRGRSLRASRPVVPAQAPSTLDAPARVTRIADGLRRAFELFFSTYDPFLKAELQERLRSQGYRRQAEAFFAGLAEIFGRDRDAIVAFNDAVIRNPQSLLFGARSERTKLLGAFLGTPVGSQVAHYLEAHESTLKRLFPDRSRDSEAGEPPALRVTDSPRIKAQKIRRAQILGHLRARAGYPEVGGECRLRQLSDERGRKIALRERRPGRGLPYTDHAAVASYSMVYCNNSGGPESTPEQRRHQKEYEAEFIREWSNVLGRESWGYVTNGGTEGNIQGIRMLVEASVTLASKERAAAQVELASIEDELQTIGPQDANRSRLLEAKAKVTAVAEQPTEPVLLLPAAKHYSNDKAASLIRLETRDICTTAGREVDLDAFAAQVRSLKGRRLVVVVTLGETQGGAIDDLPAVRDILEREAPGLFYLHADGALFGAVAHLMEPNPFGGRRILELVDSMSFSFHKWLGTICTTGALFVDRSIHELVFGAPKNRQSYVRAVDSTLAGSRAGHYFEEALVASAKVLDDPELARSILRGNTYVARWLANGLREILGNANVRFEDKHEGQMNVVFRLPAHNDALRDRLIRDYSLMTAKAHFDDREMDALGMHCLSNVDFVLAGAIIDQIREATMPEHPPRLIGDLRPHAEPHKSPPQRTG